MIKYIATKICFKMTRLVLSVVTWIFGVIDFSGQVQSMCLSRPQRLIYSRRRAHISSAVRKKGSATHIVLPLIMISNDH